MISLDARILSFLKASAEYLSRITSPTVVHVWLILVSSASHPIASLKLTSRRDIFMIIIVPVCTTPYTSSVDTTIIVFSMSSTIACSVVIVSGSGISTAATAMREHHVRLLLII